MHSTSSSATASSGHGARYVSQVKEEVSGEDSSDSEDGEKIMPWEESSPELDRVRQEGDVKSESLDQSETGAGQGHVAAGLEGTVEANADGPPPDVKGTLSGSSQAHSEFAHDELDWSDTNYPATPDVGLPSHIGHDQESAEAAYTSGALHHLAPDVGLPSHIGHDPESAEAAYMSGASPHLAPDIGLPSHIGHDPESAEAAYMSSASPHVAPDAGLPSHIGHDSESAEAAYTSGASPHVAPDVGLLGHIGHDPESAEAEHISAASPHVAPDVGLLGHIGHDPESAEAAYMSSASPHVAPDVGLLGHIGHDPESAGAAYKSSASPHITSDVGLSSHIGHDPGSAAEAAYSSFASHHFASPNVGTYGDFGHSELELLPVDVDQGDLKDVAKGGLKATVLSLPAFESENEMHSHQEGNTPPAKEVQDIGSVSYPKSPSFERGSNAAPSTPSKVANAPQPASPSFNWFVSPGSEANKSSDLTNLRADDHSQFHCDGSEVDSSPSPRARTASMSRPRPPLDDSFIDASLSGPIVLTSSNKPSYDMSGMSSTDHLDRNAALRRPSVSMWTTVVETDVPGDTGPYASTYLVDTANAHLPQDEHLRYHYDAVDSSEHARYSAEYDAPPYISVGEDLDSMSYKFVEGNNFENSPSQASSISDNSRHLSVWAKFFENAIGMKNRNREDIPSDYEYDEWPEPLDDEEHDHLMDTVISRRYLIEDSKSTFLLSKALLLAIVKCDNGATRSLLSLGADPHFKDDMLRSPLHIAAKNSTAEIVSLLCDANSDLEARDMLGRTPLHVASMFDNAEVTRYLLESAASVDATDHQNNTPLHLSCRHGSLVCASLLLKYGASLGLKNKKRLNAMGEAKSALQRGEGSKDLIDYLREAYLEIHGSNVKLPSERISKWGPPIKGEAAEDTWVQETPQRRRSLSNSKRVVEFEVSPDGRARPRLKSVETSYVSSDADYEEEDEEESNTGQNVLAQVGISRRI